MDVEHHERTNAFFLFSTNGLAWIHAMRTKKTTARFERWPWLVVDFVTRQYERVAVEAENNLVGQRTMQS